MSGDRKTVGQGVSWDKVKESKVGAEFAAKIRDFLKNAGIDLGLRSYSQLTYKQLQEALYPHVDKILQANPRANQDLPDNFRYLIAANEVRQEAERQAAAKAKAEAEQDAKLDSVAEEMVEGLFSEIEDADTVILDPAKFAVHEDNVGVQSPKVEAAAPESPAPTVLEQARGMFSGLLAQAQNVFKPAAALFGAGLKWAQKQLGFEAAAPAAPDPTKAQPSMKAEASTIPAETKVATEATQTASEILRARAGTWAKKSTPMTYPQRLEAREFLKKIWARLEGKSRSGLSTNSEQAKMLTSVTKEGMTFGDAWNIIGPEYAKLPQERRVFDIAKGYELFGQPPIPKVDASVVESTVVQKSKPLPIPKARSPAAERQSVSAPSSLSEIASTASAADSTMERRPSKPLPSKPLPVPKRRPEAERQSMSAPPSMSESKIEKKPENVEAEIQSLYAQRKPTEAPQAKSAPITQQDFTNAKAAERKEASKAVNSPAPVVPSEVRTLTSALQRNLNDVEIELLNRDNGVQLHGKFTDQVDAYQAGNIDSHQLYNAVTMMLKGGAHNSNFQRDTLMQLQKELTGTTPEYMKLQIKLNNLYDGMRDNQPYKQALKPIIDQLSDGVKPDARVKLLDRCAAEFEKVTKAEKRHGSLNAPAASEISQQFKQAKQAITELARPADRPAPSLESASEPRKPR